jgi:hypothetical protein
VFEHAMKTDVIVEIYLQSFLTRKSLTLSWYINRRVSQTQLQCYIKYTIGGGYMFQSSDHPLNKNSIKSITCEVLPHYGIPWGFTSEMLPHYGIPWGFTCEMLPHYGIPWGFTSEMLPHYEIP